MKAKSVAVSASLVIIVLILALAPSTRLAAKSSAAKGHHHYKLIDLGTFGGPQSHVNAGSGQDFANFSSILNSRGIVSGWADTPTPDPFPGFCLSEECFVVHAFEWKNGVKTDLGVLPGGASSESNWVTENGLVVGLSENGEIDPLIPGFPEFHATLWRDGKVIDLGALSEGGFESVANAANSRGQLVGLATNTVADPNSMLGLGFETRAFIWQGGVMQDLGTLPGGTDAEAVLINEKGQVVGWSYTSSTSALPCQAGFTLTTGSFIWDREKGLRDIGNLGGSCTIATDLNNRGQIVGSSTLPGDTSQHAFFWDDGLFQDLGGSLGGDFLGAFAVNEEGKAVGFAYLPGDTFFHATLWRSVGDMVDLGVVGADPSSYAASINSKNQVVGTSGDFIATSRVFLWENGDIVDLNALIPADSTLHAEFAQTINDRGEIAGTGTDAGNEHAFLAIPCDEDHPGVEGCDYSQVDAAAAEIGTRSDSVRRDASLASPALDTTEPSPGFQRSLGADSNPINQIFRRQFGWARSLRTPQASALATTLTTSLTITSGAPPSGTVGVQYGPATSEPFKCTLNPVFGWHWVCLPCSDFSAGCAGIPPCGTGLSSHLSCVRVEVVHLGFVLAASGGQSPYIWSAFGLPPGLTLNSQKGLISGTPTAAGTYRVTVTVADSSSVPLHVSAAYSITILQ